MSEIKIPCECFSRVVGYLRPVQSWNKGKQAEHNDRKFFKSNKPILNTIKLDDIVKDKSKPIYVGVELCSSCQEIKSKIEKSELDAYYKSFRNTKELRNFLIENDINISGEVELPIKIVMDQ